MEIEITHLGTTLSTHTDPAKAATAYRKAIGDLHTHVQGDHRCQCSGPILSIVDDDGRCWVVSTRTGLTGVPLEAPTDAGRVSDQLIALLAK